MRLKYEAILRIIQINFYFLFSFQNHGNSNFKCSNHTIEIKNAMMIFIMLNIL